MSLQEINIDGLVGPTHNYAGLAYGNVASQTYAQSLSNPKAAALQGLAKMRRLMQLGLPQMVMPPHSRPDGVLLTRLGYQGNIRHQMEKVARSAPHLLPYLYSSSAMWTANAATVCPSTDADGKVHIVPANLISTPHRAIEAGFTAQALLRLFPDPAHFIHHASLPASTLFGDEGAANHMRLQAGETGLHIFVYGREEVGVTPTRYPARQTLAASQAVARLMGVESIFIQQNPEAIDAGVFHNDVIATSHHHILLYHDMAFAEGDAPVQALQEAHPELCMIRIATHDLPLEEAVRTYLFNSQIIDTATGYRIIAPQECAESMAARAVLENICADATNPINAVEYIDLRESMRNGGGPACLRLRLQVTPQEWASVHHGTVLTETLYDSLCGWVNAHYRDQLHVNDLRDPLLAEEALAALDQLTHILHLERFYAFQHG